MTTKTKTKKSSDVLKAVDELVNKAHLVLFKRPCLRHGKAGEGTCTHLEDERLRKLRNTGATLPPFLYRDPERMCVECAAYECLSRAHAYLVEARTVALQTEKDGEQRFCSALGGGVNEGLGPCQLEPDHKDRRHRDAKGRSYVTFKKGTACGAEPNSLRSEAL